MRPVEVECAQSRLKNSSARVGWMPMVSFSMAVVAPARMARQKALPMVAGAAAGVIPPALGVTTSSFGPVGRGAVSAVGRCAENTRPEGDRPDAPSRG